MKSHRCSLISLRPNESTNDPPCSESSANRESEGGLRSALVGRAHRDKAGPITRNRIIIFGWASMEILRHKYRSYWSRHRPPGSN
jgi:hypothetical protein